MPTAFSARDSGPRRRTVRTIAPVGQASNQPAFRHACTRPRRSPRKALLGIAAQSGHRSLRRRIARNRGNVEREPRLARPGSLWLLAHGLARARSGRRNFASHPSRCSR